MPTQVVIPANQTSVPFTVSGLSVSGPTATRIIAKVTGRACVTDVCVVPATGFGSLSMQTESGSNCVLLTWTPLDPPTLGGQIKGYRVFRRQPGGQPTLLNPTYYGRSGEYVDVGGVAGTTYEYSVALIEDTGTVLAQSAFIAMTFPGGPGLPWSQTPSIQGDILRGEAETGQANPLGAVFVNGFHYRGASAKSTYSAASRSILGAIADTVDLPNGSASVTLVHYGPAAIKATPASSVNVSTSAKEQTLDDYLPDDGGVSRLSVQDLAAGAVPVNWTIQIKDETGNAVKTFLGEGATADVAWDGKLYDGSDAPRAIYSASAEFTDGTTYQWHPKLVKTFTEFEGIFIVGRTEYDTQGIINDYVSHIRTRMELRRQSFPEYRYVVIPTTSSSTDLGNLGYRMRAAIRRSFGTVLQDFYYYGHAGPSRFDVGGITFHANAPLVNGQYKIPDLRRPWDNLTVSYALNGRTPNSVYLDGCVTAGDTQWLQGWNIDGQPELACFVGMQSLNGALTAENSFGKQKSIWYDYNTRYWTKISSGQYMSQAISNAMRECTGLAPGFSPKDPGLIQRYGDAQIPRY